MIRHTVYFWLDESLTEDQKTEFEGGLRALFDIDVVVTGHFGKPADTPGRDGHLCCCVLFRGRLQRRRRRGTIFLDQVQTEVRLPGGLGLRCRQRPLPVGRLAAAPVR